MILPAEVVDELEPVLGAVLDAQPVSGGCVSDAARVTTASGVAFVKVDPSAPPGMFSAEEAGLRELGAAASSLRIPEVLGTGERWIALEWLEPGRATAAGDERLGRGLAELHRNRTGSWGWHRQGFIGPLPQQNQETVDWVGFWATRRLEPQLRRARQAGATVGSESAWDRLFAALPGALATAEDEGPSLLHGDLWSGNAMMTSAGEPALVDPAVYNGHREVDLAMADLFGGFGPRFRSAYLETWPLAPGYAEVRRGIYQLYYLLVHVNLFGGGYPARTRRVLDDALGAL